ncbi:hypothetical protein, partial [Streptomyces sp. NPDC007000]|uniref:hypothetical protein n=1 Tax=Streptomyces sp. NPDC007000 TaxID=3155357 RepID=UPI0033FF4016
MNSPSEGCATSPRSAAYTGVHVDRKAFRDSGTNAPDSREERVLREYDTIITLDTDMVVLRDLGELLRLREG